MARSVALWAATTETKTVAQLESGDRIFRTPPIAAGARRVYTVDHTARLPYRVVRVYCGRAGLQSFDAAGTHQFELAGEPRLVAGRTGGAER